MSEWSWDMLKHGGIMRDDTTHACNCVGPKPGQPLCPCRMKGLTKANGRWVEIIDHGPVSTHNPEKEE